MKNILFVLLLVPFTFYSQVSMNVTGTYSQNFNSLLSTGSVNSGLRTVQSQIGTHKEHLQVQIMLQVMVLIQLEDYTVSVLRVFKRELLVQLDQEVQLSEEALPMVYYSKIMVRQ